MLRRVQKEHQVHSHLTALVVLHQLFLHELLHRVDVLDLGVLALGSGAVHKVCKHQPAELHDVHGAVLVKVPRGEHFIELLARVPIHHLLEKVEEPHAVLVVDQPVVKHSEGLVGPQPDELELVLRRLANHGDTLPNLADVAHVVGVVRLPRRGQQLPLDRVVNFQRRLHQLTRQLQTDVLGDARPSAPPVRDRRVHPA